MQALELWEIHEWDGGDRTNATGKFFTNKEAADAYKVKRPHDYIYHRVLILVDNMEDLAAHTHTEMRKRALAKLSPEDKLILGIKD